jgi:Tfp pilus assembly protein PilE
MMRRFQSNSGQGLLEVVLVVAAFSTLVAVATPAYLGFQSRKADKTAQGNLAAAVPTALAYRQDRGSYAGMDSLDLYQIDPRVSPGLSVAWAKRGAFCLTDTVHGRTWSIRGPYRGDARFLANGSCER